MNLAKPCLDVGVFTNRLDEMRAFYEGEVGLPYNHLLKLGGGGHQHRLDLHGSVFKLNHHRDTLPDSPTTFRRLVIAGAGPRILHDPDGNEVELVPPGHDGVTDIAVHWATRDVATLGSL